MRVRCLVLALLAAGIGLSTAGMASAQSGSGPLLAVEDGRGDAGYSEAGGPVMPPVGLPPNAFMDPFDIVNFRVESETTEALEFVIQVADLDGTFRQNDPVGSYRYFVRFQIDGSPVRYEAFAMTAGPVPDTSEPVRAAAALCLYGKEVDDYNMFECRPQSIWAYLAYEADEVRLRIPKAALLGVFPPLEDPPAGLPGSLPSGTEVTNWLAIAARKDDGNSYSSSTRERWEDWAPDEGPLAEAVTLRHSAPNAVVRFGGLAGLSSQATSVYFGGMVPPEDLVPTAGVAPGSPQAVPVTVVNDGASKRLVNLSVEVEGQADGWSFRLAPTIEVPADGRRTVSLLVNASDELAHGRSVSLRVVGTSLGHPDEVAMMRLEAFAVQPPTAAQPVLHLHQYSDPRDLLVVEAGDSCLPPGSACGSGDVRRWMNVLAEDSGANDETVEGYPLLPLIPSALYGGRAPLMEALFELDAPFPSKPYFADGDPASVHVELTAPSEVEAEVVLTLEVGVLEEECATDCRNWLALGQDSVTTTLGPEPTAIDVSLPVDPSVAAEMDAQSQLRFSTAVWTEDWPAHTAAGVEPIELLLSPSQVRLPLVVPPEGAGGIPSFLGLYPAGDQEEFVNPGETRLFHFLLSHEGVATTVAQVGATAEPAAWSAEVRPGTHFQLEPGETVNLSLLVESPSAAAEGDSATVTVTAEPVGGEGAATRLDFALTATEGVDLPDEQHAYEENEEAAAKVYRDDGGESPAVEAALVALAACLAAAFRGRRAGR